MTKDCETTKKSDNGGQTPCIPETSSGFPVKNKFLSTANSNPDSPKISMSKHAQEISRSVIKYQMPFFEKNPFGFRTASNFYKPTTDQPPGTPAADNIFASRTTLNFYKARSVQSETECEIDTQNIAHLTNTGQSFYKNKVDAIDSGRLEESDVEVSENELTLNPESKIKPKYYDVPIDSRLMRKKTQKVMISELKNCTGGSTEGRVSLKDIKLARTNLFAGEGNSIQRNRIDLYEKSAVKKIQSKSPSRSAASDSLRENYNPEDSIQELPTPIHSLGMDRNSK